MEPPPVNHPTTIQEAFSDSFLIRYPWTGWVISVMYLIIVKILQKYMENRPAYNLKNIMRIYNVIQVVVCGKLVLMSFSSEVWSTFLKDVCPPDDFSSSFYISGNDIALLYIILKVLDLCDTVFIILRRKESHLSFLHIFHHCSMIALSCYGYVEGEALGMPIGAVNSFVHVIMYSYYCIASFESQRWVYKYKKYITQIQLIQFIFSGVYVLFAVVYKGCHVKRNSLIMGYILLSVLFIEFSRFYVTNYIRRKEKIK